MENIAILTGGDSAEYNISLLSAKTVLKHLNTRKYAGIIVHLKNGKYTINDQTLDTSDFSYIKNKKKVKRLKFLHKDVNQLYPKGIQLFDIENIH